MPVFVYLTASVELLPLIKILFEITVFRKGPEHIPRSSIVFVLGVIYWLLALLVSIVLIDYIDETDFFPEILWVLVVLSIYGGVVAVSGHSDRIVQTLTAIIGCGALVSFYYAIAYSLLGASLGKDVADLLVYGFVLWSLSVKGHIIASAINRQWYIGIVLATAIFCLQLVVNTILSATP